MYSCCVHGGYLHDQVQGWPVDVQLLSISLATGVLDAISYPEFGVFVSNQTGNTIFLAISAIGIDRSLLGRASVSLGSFLASVFLAGRLGMLWGARSRWWLLLSNAVQTILVILVYIFITTKAIPLDDSPNIVYIALLSISSGFQVAAARELQVDIPTAMLTSPFVVLLVDERLFHLRNGSRDRRIGHILAMLLGAFIGSATYRYAGTGPAFIVTFALKSAITMSYFLNPRAKIDQPQEG